MEQASFTHTVSKGSRFKQIYIPRNAEEYFEAGDLVQVRLLKKKTQLFYSPELMKIQEFKEEVVRRIFNIFSRNKNIDQVFIFGSFLTKDTDYHDIDVLIFSKEDLENEAHRMLNKKIGLKFHVLSAQKEKFLEELKVSPPLRSMLSSFVSNKPFEVPKETHINENYIRYLLMMPEDLLKVKLDEGKVYYDSLRKLITIEYFLKKKETSPNFIDHELYKVMEKRKIDLLRDNRFVSHALLKEIRGVIKTKLKVIKKLLKYGKK